MRGIGRINENGSLDQRRNGFPDQLDPLGADLGKKNVKACQISTRTGEADHESGVHWVADSSHHNWNSRGRLLGCSWAGCAMRYDYIDVEFHQLGRKFGKAVVSALGPPILD